MAPHTSREHEAAPSHEGAESLDHPALVHIETNKAQAIDQVRAGIQESTATYLGFHADKDNANIVRGID